MNSQYTIQPELLRSALGVSMKNAELQRIFKSAPQSAKPVLKLEFVACVFPDKISDEAFSANLKYLTESLDDEALQYLIENETDEGLKEYFEALLSGRNGGSNDAGNSSTETSRGSKEQTERSSCGKSRKKSFWGNRRNRLIVTVGLVVVVVELILGGVGLSRLTDSEKDSRAEVKQLLGKSAEGGETVGVVAAEKRKKQEIVRENARAEVDESRQEHRQTPKYFELASEICGGKRMTYPQFKSRLDELEEKLGKKLSESGYWAYRFEGQDALRIMVGETEGGLEGSIQEGLNGGFTYPAWLPARDAKYIWEQFFLLKRIEESFLRSPFLMSAKEERRLKEEIAKDPRVERERLAYAKKKLAPLVLDIERYVYVQRKYLCVNAIEVVDRRWSQLVDAQSKSDWVRLINVALDRRDQHCPEEEIVDEAARTVRNTKWPVEIRYRATDRRVFNLESFFWRPGKNNGMWEKCYLDSSRMGKSEGYSNGRGEKVVETSVDLRMALIIYPGLSTNGSDEEANRQGKAFYETKEWFEEELERIERGERQRRYGAGEADVRRREAFGRYQDRVRAFMGCRIELPE